MVTQLVLGNGTVPVYDDGTRLRRHLRRPERNAKPHGRWSCESDSCASSSGCRPVELNRERHKRLR
jgi:hypothetical protein